LGLEGAEILYLDADMIGAGPPDRGSEKILDVSRHDG